MDEIGWATDERPVGIFMERIFEVRPTKGMCMMSSEREWSQVVRVVRRRAADTTYELVRRKDHGYSVRHVFNDWAYDVDLENGDEMRFESDAVVRVRRPLVWGEIATADDDQTAMVTDDEGIPSDD